MCIGWKSPAQCGQQAEDTGNGDGFSLTALALAFLAGWMLAGDGSRQPTRRANPGAGGRKR